MFAHGNVIVLESTATNKSLRIRDGIVEGTGGRGQLAQFTVHVRRPGVIALQNVKNPDLYLAIYEGTTNGNVCSIDFEQQNIELILSNVTCTCMWGNFCRFKVSHLCD